MFLSWFLGSPILHRIGNALHAGVSIFELSRLMGASIETIQTHYGHLVRESEDHLRGLLSGRSGGFVASDDIEEA